ncbi:MAG: 30S ribosomal protein S18, small subunit ribosomal protein S18 [Candidatus Peregrinibacteria bacterium GW2011_GWF2_33_10]|nr:MAG: 30S ribosomal protein S18, small subunit ribosomal protein S18 [Candidatus Peregrinibacteria bacterium GW2011_GWF2_33_10]OGJ44946.1 MAG: 30S ribosomal protein S18 [Candidatus Peregrinibacteria bacterium RIFOXYA12_FULL_33_12]OGJ45244.1 MAG: 30S ribosomal protein S18 [Candidatus Peregrinibacteria bacterium RIFOXYA2_FULL_33_21]OGJ51168.1 MAG: 30S ribosomal protein S18 [Candidatus Peregrinibacteria bacterium RIFOXYB2_FULL_33_20]
MSKLIYPKGKNRAGLIHKLHYIDYKDANLLKIFTDMYGRIVPRRYTGLSVKQQKDLAKAIKRSRLMGFLPFIK